MVENLINLKNDILDLWNGFDKKVKIIIASAVIGSMVAILVLANWASQPDYDVLFKNLDPEDSGQVVERLQEENVPYRLDDGGRTVLVPSQQVYEMRVRLASGDLPSGGVTGFEIFDRTQIGATDFEQQVNYQRALSGELTRTISQIENIEYAEVQITPRRDSIYLSDEEPAKASVLVALKPGSRLQIDHIRGIANLVASGVEGLQPKNVTIVDSLGNLLSAQLDSDEDDFDFNGDQLQLRRRVENDIQRNLTVMLSRVFGPDNFAISVNAELNFDKQDVISKQYEPVVNDEGIIRSEQGYRESSEGRSSESGGVPGTTSNIPQYETEDGDYESYEAEEWTRNYEVNERVENIVRAPGAIERLSVSVMVDQDIIADDSDPITEAIEAAVGYNENRGDRISVTAVQFDDSLEQLVAQRRAEEQASRDRLIRFIAILIVVLIIIVVVIFRRQSGSEKEKAEKEREGIDYTVATEAESEEVATSELSEEEQERKRILGDIRELVAEQPEEIAELIKSWLVEE